MLLTIRVILSMFMQINENSARFRGLLKCILEAAIREYVHFMNDRIFENCLNTRFRYTADCLLEAILTDYIRLAMDLNQIKGDFDMPIAVTFGKKLLSKLFVCASSN